MDQTPEPTQEYVLAGGGLQNCLIALLLLHKQPAVHLTLVEQGSTLGGNHTWSFHASDVPWDCAQAIAPALSYTWERYDVVFPNFRRTVNAGYQTITSTRMHEVLRSQFAGAPNARLLLQTKIASVGSDHVALNDGRVLRGRHVIDARGLAGEILEGQAGFQKFVGLELELAQPSEYIHPILMDARVPQRDGFRFFYILPMAPNRVLIEDTRFSDSPALDVGHLRSAVLRYGAEKGLAIREVVRQESGVLPMPYVMRRDWTSQMPLLGGYAGGFHHPATGYSFPVALRLAKYIANRAPDSPFDEGWNAFLRAHQRQYRFATLLNRLLFSAYPPAKRFHIFQRFYHLPEQAIERFYRMEMTGSDRARFFLGRPPRGFSVRRILEGAPES